MPNLGPRPTDLRVPSEAEIRRRVQRQAVLLLGAFIGASFLILLLLPAHLLEQFGGLIVLGLVAALIAVFSLQLAAAGRREAALVRTLSLFLDGLPVGVLFTDPDGKVSYANPAIASLVAGDPKADLVGRPGIGFVVPEDRARIAAEMAKRREGDVSTYQVRGTNVQGKMITAVITATPFQKEGAFDGSIAVIVDVTDVVEAQARATRYRDLASFALDVVTHDLSNRMQAVVAQAAIAGAVLGKDDAKAKKAIDAAAKAADHAGRLIKEVKQIAAAEREQWPKRRMPVRELLEKAARMAELPAPLTVSLGLSQAAEAAHIEASDLGALGLAKMVEFAAEGAQAEGQGLALDADVGAEGAVLLRVSGYRTPVSDKDLALMLAPPAEIGKRETAWRSGIKLALAAAIWQAKGWKAGARREGAAVVLEVRAPGS